jgi:hypothetical protein
MSSREIVAYCPHCGNEAPQRLLLSHNYEKGGWYSEDGELADMAAPSLYHIRECCTCHDLLLYHELGADHAESSADDVDLVYPQPKDLDLSVPSSVRACYAEAARIQEIAPNAYAVMVRRALEALCDDRGAKAGSLASRLTEIATRGEMPPTLVEMTTVLRKLGNAGAHASSQPVTVPLTWHMDDFFRAVIEYVYVAPSKLKAFLNRLSSNESGDQE